MTKWALQKRSNSRILNQFLIYVYHNNLDRVNPYLSRFYNLDKMSSKRRKKIQMWIWSTHLRKEILLKDNLLALDLLMRTMSRRRSKRWTWTNSWTRARDLGLRHITNKCNRIEKINCANSATNWSLSERWRPTIWPWSSQLIASIRCTSNA
jgi:hypothetical protein